MLLLLLSRFSHVRLCATPETAAPRLPWPWDSPGKNTVVGCHFLLQCRKVKVKSLSRDQLFATPWTTASQAPPPMGFSRQEYWSGVPLPSPRFRNNNFKRKKVAFFGFWYVLFCAFVWGGAHFVCSYFGK